MCPKKTGSICGNRISNSVLAITSVSSDSPAVSGVGGPGVGDGGDGGGGGGELAVSKFNVYVVAPSVYCSVACVSPATLSTWGPVEGV